jgi:cytochrome c oxidase subunit 2
LDPAGIQAERFSQLWWPTVAITTAIYVAVMLAILVAVFRRRGSDLEEAAPDTSPEPLAERRHSWIVGGAVAASIVVLFGLLIGDLMTGRAVRSLSREPDPLLIKVTGRQWWWEVLYEEGSPSQFVTTANELHLPLGRTVAIDLHSTDVIHSFWIPNLHGKMDMIPGHPTRLFLRADRPGTYWGQCAEFCGHQHAKMRFAVIVEPEDEFEAWLASARKPAVEPSSDSERRGQQVFLGTTCVMCHTIQGTPARGTVGPNLTHIASRSRLAAGSLPNTRGHLAGWVTDPQRIKPGVRMPMNPLSPEELRSLLDYLERLK